MKHSVPELSQPTASQVPEGLAGIRVVFAYIKVFARWRRERREAAHLCAMSDHLLADIGIGRSEIAYRVRRTR